MMRRQQPDNLGEMDDHDSPTEPMSQVFLSPLSSTIPYSHDVNGVPPNGATFPTPAPYEQPFPQQNVPDYPQPGTFNRPSAQVYPVLPPVSTNGKYRPAGGLAPISSDGSGLPTHIKSSQAGRSSIPLWVGVFLVAVQLLLLVRFVLQLLGYSSNSLWVGLFYAVSSMFVFPFRALLYSLTSSLTIGSDFLNLLAILFAILMYGLLSRILVRFLKALLHSR
jgi:hypothetical protein